MSSVFHENLGVRISARRTVAAITSVFPQTDDHINDHYLFFNKVVNYHDHDGDDHDGGDDEDDDDDHDGGDHHIHHIHHQLDQLYSKETVITDLMITKIMKSSPSPSSSHDGHQQW